MRQPITYKLRSAVGAARLLPGGENTEYPQDEKQREMLYTWLADKGYCWVTSEQRWRPRKPGTRGPKKHTIIKAEFVLVRIMAKREILDRDRENFALAFEAIGYDVIEFGTPIENRDNGYFRVYLKARTK